MGGGHFPQTSAHASLLTRNVEFSKLSASECNPGNCLLVFIQMCLWAISLDRLRLVKALHKALIFRADVVGEYCSKLGAFGTVPTPHQLCNHRECICGNSTSLHNSRNGRIGRDLAPVARSINHAIRLVAGVHGADSRECKAYTGQGSRDHQRLAT